jgi:hypothetical protein
MNGTSVTLRVCKYFGVLSTESFTFNSGAIVVDFEKLNDSLTEIKSLFD